jgi:tetratricopeptide (TPR) repeat protein
VQLDFHPLSITLLATVAQHSEWSTGRLAKEWERQRTGVLHTKHKGSLADTIELSLVSPTFQELGPDARDLLGVVAFFPQGVDENNLDWLFPTISNGTSIFDTFCMLSLTYRSDRSVTILAPLRDHLCPKDPGSSPFLRTTKEHYFHRLTIEVHPGTPGFDEAQWITLEDVNIEHLLDASTSIDGNSDEVWGACAHFMEHLYWHKPRLITLGSKIKGLPNHHPSKAKCLFWLARLFHEVGNYAESKRLLIHTLKSWREQGNNIFVAETLWSMSGINRMLGLYGTGIQQVQEALGIYERLDDVSGQARSLCRLAYLLHGEGQLYAAEGVALQVINRFPGKREQDPVCDCYRLLGNICHCKGETEKAIEHFKAALRITSSFNWHIQLLWIHLSLANLSFDKDKFDDAHTHIEHAKSYALNNAYSLGRVVEQQAQFWYWQGRFEEARSAASHTADVFERLGAMEWAEECRALLRDIERATKKRV